MSENVDPWYNTAITDNGRLKYLSIALTGACNMDCVFCYVGGARAGEWALPDIAPILADAFQLGVSKVQLSGGEPLLYSRLQDLLQIFADAGAQILLATNGTLITPNTARMLADFKVQVGVSIETIDQDLSDRLSGVRGSHGRKLMGIKCLLDAGFADHDDLVLNLLIKTLTENLPSFLETWRWAKSQGIQPILDRAIPAEKCTREMVANGRELRKLLDGISKIEGVEHVIPFLCNEGCNRIGSSVHIELGGDVFPCAGVPVSMGNLMEQTLRDIWSNSPLAIDCRHYRERLKGNCQTCKHRAICSGCRAIAYATTGDMFGPDTLCWHQEE